MKKVLIIEDEMDTAKVLEKRVSSLGLESVVVHDAYSGIAQIRKEEPDLVLLDLMLPAGGGLSVLQNLRLHTHARHVPVIVLTAMRDTGYKKTVMELGVEAYIEKPYDPEVLISAIKGILGGQGE